MSEPFDPKRRAISVAAALTLLGFPAVTLSGCGGGGSPSSPSNPNPTPTPGPGDAQGVISANHGHTAVVTAAELQAGNGLTLHIRGSATHDHTVDLTGTDIVAVRSRQRVSKTTSVNDAHDHGVTFN